MRELGFEEFHFVNGAGAAETITIGSAVGGGIGIGLGITYGAGAATGGAKFDADIIRRTGAPGRAHGFRPVVAGLGCRRHDGWRFAPMAARQSTSAVAAV